jgi:spoIIIJ-associated protein
MDETARDSAPPPREAPEKVARTKEFCEGLLARLGAEVDVAVRETPEQIGVSLSARPANQLELSSALVEAIQYLVNRVVKAMAERLAATAKRMGKVLAVAPISARERRQIHLALVDAPGVSTRSEGEGIFRQLLILPSPPQKGGQG